MKPPLITIRTGFLVLAAALVGGLGVAYVSSNALRALAETASKPVLKVTLTADPATGNAPLSSVVLTAKVTGANGTDTLNYTFYCNRNDGASTEITPLDSVLNPGEKWNGRTETTFSTNPGSSSADDKAHIYAAANHCQYKAAGTYTAKVIVEHANADAAYATATITVGTSTAANLDVSLQVVPTSAALVKNGSAANTLKATVNNPPAGATFTYHFYCDRNDNDSEDVQSGTESEVITTTAATAQSSKCTQDYTEAKRYYPKVIVEVIS